MRINQDEIACTKIKRKQLQLLPKSLKICYKSRFFNIRHHIFNVSQAKRIRFDHEISDSESECLSACRSECESAKDDSELGEAYASDDMYDGTTEDYDVPEDNDGKCSVYRLHTLNLINHIYHFTIYYIFIFFTIISYIFILYLL